jgi:hypothetical protein
MERAVWCGVKSARNIPVVGLQTGLLASNQMGFAFPAEETRAKLESVNASPLPDVIAAYGTHLYSYLVSRLPSDRVCLSGAVRYPHLSEEGAVDVAAFRRQRGLPDGMTYILVTTPIDPDESSRVVEGAFSMAKEYPDTFLLFKLHYHLPIYGEITRAAAQYGCNRYKIFDSDLPLLLRLASISICGSSSVGVEAIASGCMPMVFRSTAGMSTNPMLEVPRAAFFWNSVDELRQGIQACLELSPEYDTRRRAWPEAIAAHLYRLDGDANSRLYEFLQRRAIF